MIFGCGDLLRSFCGDPGAEHITAPAHSRIQLQPHLLSNIITERRESKYSSTNCLHTRLHLPHSASNAGLAFDHKCLDGSPQRNQQRSYLKTIEIYKIAACSDRRSDMALSTRVGSKKGDPLASLEHPGCSAIVQSSWGQLNKNMENPVIADPGTSQLIRIQIDEACNVLGMQ